MDASNLEDTALIKDIVDFLLTKVERTSARNRRAVLHATIEAAASVIALETCLESAKNSYDRAEADRRADKSVRTFERVLRTEVQHFFDVRDFFTVNETKMRFRMLPLPPKSSDYEWMNERARRLGILAKYTGTGNLEPNRDYAAIPDLVYSFDTALLTKDIVSAEAQKAPNGWERV
ncbi:MAG: hypothetical protein JKY60_07290 [Kordiimonadaceae bacterium]|nr:hypothetical protein [Kordiimonadaceae bacterium]